MIKNIDDIVKDVKVRLRQYHMEDVTDSTGMTKNVMVLDHPEDNPILEQLVRQEYRFIVEWMHFPYSDDVISDEMYGKFRTLWINCVLYEFVKEGAEFQTSHTELGITRNWKDKSDVFRGYVPYTTICS